MTYYIHHVSGRLRIKSPVVPVRGIDRVNVNVATGGCVIHYDPKVANRDHIVSVLSCTRYFNPSLAITHDEVVRRASAKCFHLLSALI